MPKPSQAVASVTESPPQSTAASERFLTYEQLLGQDLEWALTEGSLYFEGRGRVQDTLTRITRRLDELGIPYAVAGGSVLPPLELEFAAGWVSLT